VSSGNYGTVSVTVSALGTENHFVMTTTDMLKDKGHPADSKNASPENNDLGLECY
jgi:hypothetical protein